MSRVLILSAVIFSAASGCVAETTDPNVIGKYVSSLSCAGESIVLHADGRFTHRYDSRSEVGNWEIDSRGNRIIFQKISVPNFDQEAGSREMADVASFPVRSSRSGVVVIIVNEDHDCRFTLEPVPN